MNSDIFISVVKQGVSDLFRVLFLRVYLREVLGRIEERQEKFEARLTAIEASLDGKEE